MRAGSAERAYLSVVVAARNDDHGGGFIGRMQLFVDNLMAQCDRCGIDAELVVVEWNPPPGRESLARAIAWPASTRCAARIVVVPPDVHQSHENAERLALFQMIAKNVGIRRASGRFVLATNVDVLFSDGLMQAIGRRCLDPSCFYRVDRHDVSQDVPVLETPEAQLKACADRVVRINGREATVDLRTGDTLTIYPTKRRSGRGYRTAEVTYVMLAELVLSVRRVLLALRHVGDRGASATIRTAYAEQARLRERALMFRQNWAVVSARLHTNACGDFTLMARESWLRLRGYDELPVSAWHIDSRLLHRAHRIGVGEECFPHPLYHIEHERPDEPGVPRLTYDDLRAWVYELRRSRAPVVTNGENWGLASYELVEIAVG